MDALAIRPALFEMAERIATEGYLVLLPDLFFRAGGYAPVDATVVFATGDVVATLAPLMQSTNETLSTSDCEVCLDYLAERAEVDGSKVLVTGYCMGGAIALRLAGLFPDRIATAASFHAGYLVTDSENSPHRLAGNMRSPVYVGMAEADPHFTTEMAETLASAFDVAGVSYDMELYAGTAHGWTMVDLPVHSPAATEQHWNRLFALFEGAEGEK